MVQKPKTTKLNESSGKKPVTLSLEYRVEGTEQGGKALTALLAFGEFELRVSYPLSGDKGDLNEAYGRVEKGLDYLLSAAMPRYMNSQKPYGLELPPRGGKSGVEGLERSTQYGKR